MTNLQKGESVAEGVSNCTEDGGEFADTQTQANKDVISDKIYSPKLSTEIVLDSLLNCDNECILVINADGLIEMFSLAYAKVLGVDRDSFVGRHINELAANNGLIHVLKTEKSEIATPFEHKGKKLFISRTPIIKDGKILGAFANVVFKSLKEVETFYEEFRNVKHSLDLYKNALINSYSTKYSLDNIITNDPEMLQIKTMISRVAQTNSGVLITGETGTGKELVAHAIHNMSTRSKGPFVTANCGAIPHDLLESELFGYEEGAFTDASQNGKLGLLKIADGGTIFLDEIGDLPVSLQVKLLRFLQEKEIRRLGSNVTEKVDIRVIAATNCDLQKMTAEGTFRSDLYYRLCVVHIQIPPLRTRRGDIPLLVDHLSKKICERNGIKKVKICEEALLCLQSYDWSGNIRELENALESAINFVGKDRIVNMHTLPHKLLQTGQESLFELLFHDQQDLKSAVYEYEKQYIKNALRCNNNKKIKTAKMLGISRTKLYEKLQQYGISKNQ
jgi:transcriptional regulator with PAS, ATPase and Fis domain